MAEDNPAPPPKFDCRGEKPCVRGIIINGSTITSEMADYFNEQIAEAKEAGVDALIVVWHSPGGETISSRRIFLAFRKSPVPIHCYVPGIAASGAFWALQGCKERAMAPGAMLMTHEPMVKTNLPLNRRNLVEILKSLEETARLMAGDCVSRMKIKLQEYLDKVAEGDWTMNAPEAYEVGAVDHIYSSLEDYLQNVKEQYGGKKHNVNRNADAGAM